MDAVPGYELSEAEYAAREANTTWVHELLGALVACLQWLQPILSPDNYDSLVASVLEKVRAGLTPAKTKDDGCSACDHIVIEYGDLGM